MTKRWLFSLMFVIGYLVSACAPAQLPPAATATTLPTVTPLPTATATQPPTDTPAPTATPKPTLTARPSSSATLAPTQTATADGLVTSTITPIPTNTPVLALVVNASCVSLSTGGFFISYLASRTVHLTVINFNLVEKSGSFAPSAEPGPVVVVTGGDVSGRSKHQAATCQTAGACTAIYEAPALGGIRAACRF